jgi:diadenosine tetraphosphate (Ap4A) HIT family hydrolase
MSQVTVFEQTMRNYADWSGEGDAPAYPIYESSDFVALIDRFPKFIGQVVIFPSHGTPGENVAPYDLPPVISLGIDYLSRKVQSRMSKVFPSSRIIRHEEGFAVPDHPHVVLFPAARGDGKKLYEPSLLKPDDAYFKEAQRQLRLEDEQKKLIDERLKRLAEAVIEWT